MKPTVLVTMVAAGSLGGLVLTPAVDAFAKTATETTITSTEQSGGGSTQLAQHADGAVAPSPPKGEHVTVKYFKKTPNASRKWKHLGTHKPALDSNGAFKTHFTGVPAHGVCKLTAHYLGDSKYSDSRAKVIIACASGKPKS